MSSVDWWHVIGGTCTLEIMKPWFHFMLIFRALFSFPLFLKCWILRPAVLLPDKCCNKESFVLLLRCFCMISSICHFLHIYHRPRRGWEVVTDGVGGLWVTGQLQQSTVAGAGAETWSGPHVACLHLCAERGLGWSREKTCGKESWCELQMSSFTLQC